MKKIIVIVLIFTLFHLCLFSQDTIIRQDTLYESEILKFNYSTYIGKEVWQFITNDNIRKYERYTFFDEPPGLLGGIYLKISKNLFIEIGIKDYKYVDKLNMKRDWNFDLMKKELVSVIRFWYIDKVVLEFK
jgi:hypothetical protein